MVLRRGPLIAVALATLVLAGPSQAQPRGGWGGPYMGPMLPLPGPDYGAPYGGHDPREGKIEAATFVGNSPAVGQLGHGSIVLAASGGVIGGGIDQGAYESALVDQLAKAGYRTDAPPTASGQTVEFVVSRDVVQPPEPPHSPVSGGVSAGAGSYGSGLGIAVGIDLSKPRKALVGTRIEARIRDSATHELLWQGRAQVVSREADKHWTPEATAARLTAALFKDFPRPTAVDGH